MKVKNNLKKSILQYLLVFILFTAVLGVVHQSIYNYFLENTPLYFSIWNIYVFLSFLYLIGYSLLIFTFFISKKHLGFAFIAGIILKMFASLWYLFPFIDSDLSNKIPDVANFFLPFFLLLVMDAYFSIRLLKL